MGRWVRLRWMVRSRPVGWWLVVTTVVAVAGATWWHATERAQVEARAWGRRATVAVLVHDVPAGRTVAEDDVRLEARPVAVLPGASLDEAPVGATARVDLVAGEVLVAGRLAPPVGHGGVLGAGEVALAVPVGDDTPPVAAGDPLLVLGPADAGAWSAGSAGVVVLSERARVLGADAATVLIALPRADAPAVAAALGSGGLVLAVAPAP